MSDIKKGDLVVVIAADCACGDTTSIGSIFRVDHIATMEDDYFCPLCYKRIEQVPHAYDIEHEIYIDLKVLKKINPSRDEDYVETDNFMLA